MEVYQGGQKILPSLFGLGVSDKGRNSVEGCGDCKAQTVLPVLRNPRYVYERVSLWLTGRFLPNPKGKLLNHLDDENFPQIPIKIPQN